MNTMSVLFSLRGRITRKQYWLQGFVPMAIIAAITTAAAIILIAAAAIALDQKQPSQAMKWAAFLLLIVPILAFIKYTETAVAIKRLHDINHSGWWVLLQLAPGVGFLLHTGLLILLGVMPGKPGDNRHGLDDESQDNRNEKSLA